MGGLDCLREWIGYWAVSPPAEEIVSTWQVVLTHLKWFHPFNSWQVISSPLPGNVSHANSSDVEVKYSSKCRSVLTSDGYLVQGRRTTPRWLHKSAAGRRSWRRWQEPADRCQ